MCENLRSVTTVSAVELSYLHERRHMSGRLENKVAVVTGAARGIGRGCAEMLAAQEAHVVAADMNLREGEATVDSISHSGGSATFRHVDITSEEQCGDLMAYAVSTYGRLDGLVNNAGWFPRATLEETTTELWERVLAIDLRGAFYCCKHAVPHLREAGGGSIVNMGSVHGIQGSPNLFAYSAAKGGLLAMTRTLAGAYASENIRVNYVIPGWVLTEAEIEMQRSQGMSEDDLRRAGASLPLGRHQTIKDVAYAIVYLISDESSQVTGTVLPVDAGVSALPIRPQGEYPA